MANPLTSGLGGVNPLGIVGAAASLRGRVKARSKFKKARKLSRLNQQLTFVQQRRAFIRQARQAQAANLVAGVATGADLASSAFQGSQASLKTQTATALGEQRDTQARNVQIGQLVESGQRSIATGDLIQGITGAATDFLKEFK
jgi:hypothetical protein